MNREILFFDYDKCYNHYVKCVDSIRQKHSFGHINVAKPVLLIAIIDAIEENVFSHNHFSINDWLEKRYKLLMSLYSKDSLFRDKTSIDKPFWHLETDGFWHLNYQGVRLNKGCTPSKAWLKDNVEFAYFDESLWILLQNETMRKRLRNYIIESKLPDDHDGWISKAADGFSLIAGLLLAVA